MKAGPARVRLQPLGQDVTVARGGLLADALVEAGAEFPCGGRGRCRGCRVRVREGTLAETDADRRSLTPDERRDGWRLACQARVEGDLAVELRQWEGVILADESAFTFEPGDGLGVAVDIGTTTLVAQLLDLATGRVLGTRTALNPQARDGADVMSRVGAALAGDGAERLQRVIRDRVAAMVAALLEDVAPSLGALRRGVLVGNSAMHHLFLGRDLAPLARAPFLPDLPGAGWMDGASLAWPARAARARVCFLPCLGGFVGSDILGVLLATRLHESARPVAAADLGTNGEIVVSAGGGGPVFVASTAAGPAFEGARITHGMRAAPGAIDRVTADGHGMAVHVVGGGPPRGVCGSGLVDAVACGLDLGTIAPSGRMAAGEWRVRGPVPLTPGGVREVQLAQGAIAAGLRGLTEAAGWRAGGVTAGFLAGAFGKRRSGGGSRRRGLLPFRDEAVVPVGNAALRGAKIALFLADLGTPACDVLLPRVRHLRLEQSPGFEDRFAAAMAFPEWEAAA